MLTADSFAGADLILGWRTPVEAGVTNVEFLQAAVLAEAGLVLRPGGRFAVSDVIATGLYLLLGPWSPDLLRQSGESLAGLISYVELTPFTSLEIPKKDPLDRLWLRGGFPGSYLAVQEDPEEIGTCCRRKGLYSSHLNTWRQTNCFRGRRAMKRQAIYVRAFLIEAYRASQGPVFRRSFKKCPSHSLAELGNQNKGVRPIG